MLLDESRIGGKIWYYLVGCFCGLLGGFLALPLEVLASLCAISGFTVKERVKHFLALWDPRQGLVPWGSNFLRHDSSTGLLSPLLHSS